MVRGVGEKQNVEWKSDWKDEYLAWICGFANAQGGVLMIGVDDSGKPVGLRGARKLLTDLPNKIRNALGVVVDVNLREGPPEYIEIDVPRYPVPISSKGVYYIRSGSTNQRLSGVDLESFIMRRRGVSWDTLPVPRADISDIDEQAVMDFCEKAVKKGRLDASVMDESVEDIIDKLRLRKGEYLTNAALLLFGKNPDRWFLCPFSKVGFFEMADLIYMDEVHGPLLRQADRAIDLIYFKYLKAKVSYDGIIREERYPYPKEAVREALLNAIVHKDYESGIPIQISVYDDKLYIANIIGRLPEIWTAEKLMAKHTSAPYNPALANVFYLAGYIESWGRGVEKICLACKEDGVPNPEYSVSLGDIMIKFTAPEDRIIRTDGRLTDDHATEKTTRSVIKRITKAAVWEQAIIELIRENPNYTTAELANELSVSRQMVSRRIKTLKDKGIIVRRGSPTKGYWEIASDE